MLRIEIKEGENIERALKRYKRKHRNVKVMQNLRENQFFTKPSENADVRFKKHLIFKV